MWSLECMIYIYFVKYFLFTLIELFFRNYFLIFFRNRGYNINLNKKKDCISLPLVGIKSEECEKLIYTTEQQQEYLCMLWILFNTSIFVRIWLNRNTFNYRIALFELLFFIFIIDYNLFISLTYCEIINKITDIIKRSVALLSCVRACVRVYRKYVLPRKT